MPILYFELKDPCLTFEGDEESDKWSLTVSGTCTNWVSSKKKFTVKSGTNSYDGFGAEAVIYIEKRPQRSEVQGIPTNKPINPDDKYRDKIRVICPSLPLEQPFFEVSVSLPHDAYQHFIDADWTKQTLILSVQNQLAGQALVCGEDTDEIEWHADRENTVFLTEVGLHFLSRGTQRFRRIKGESKNTDLFEQVLASVERVTLTIGELRASIIRATWVLAAVLLITIFIK